MLHCSLVSSSWLCVCVCLCTCVYSGGFTIWRFGLQPGASRLGGPRAFNPYNFSLQFSPSPVAACSGLSLLIVHLEVWERVWCECVSTISNIYLFIFQYLLEIVGVCMIVCLCVCECGMSVPMCVLSLCRLSLLYYSRL